MKKDWSVIKHLRAMFPNETWKYKYREHSWAASSGWRVRLYKAPEGAPYTCKVYCRTDTKEVLFNEHGGLVFDVEGKKSSRFDLIE